MKKEKVLRDGLGLEELEEAERRMDELLKAILEEETREDAAKMAREEKKMMTKKGRAISAKQLGVNVEGEELEKGAGEFYNKFDVLNSKLPSIL